MMRRLRRFGVPPDCRDVARVLQSYLDGELPEAKHRAVAEHLAHCVRCGIDEHVYRAVKRSLGQLAAQPDHNVVRRLRSHAEDLSTCQMP